VPQIHAHKNVKTDGLIFSLDGKNKRCAVTGNRTQLVNNFDGTDEYLTSSDTRLRLGDESFTFGGWFYFDEVSTSPTLIGIWAGNTQRSFQLRRETTNIKFYISTNGTDFNNNTSPLFLPPPTFSGIAASQWYFIVGVHDKDNDQVKLSVDAGSFITETWTTGANTGTTTDFNIGSQQNGIVPLNGRAKSCFIYKKALTLDEITTLYTWGVGTKYAELTNSQGLRKDIISELDLSAPNPIGTISDTLPINVVKDLGLSKLPGTPINGVTTDSNNQIWEFDGTDDYVDFGDKTDLDLDEFTIELWCKLNSGSTDNHHIIEKREDAKNDNFINYVINWNTTSNFLNMTSSNGTTFKEARWTSTDLQTDTWYHFTMTYDGSNLYNIVNGEIKATLSESFTPYKTGNQPLILGKSNGFSGREMDGQISNVKIYNRALTSDEVKYNYESTKKYFTTAEVRDSLILELNSRYPLTIDEGNNIWSSRVGGLTGSMESDASYDGLDMDFDGTDDNVNFGDILDMGLNSYTLEAWVYLKGNNTSNDWLISKSFANVGNYRWGLGLAGTNQLYPLVVGSGNTVVLPTGNTSLSLNTWYMVNMVIDRSANILLYINGESESYTGSGNISAFSAQDFQTTHPLRIGSYTAADNTSPTNASNTKISIVKIYNRVLTADEVLRNYNFNKHRFQ
jgi:hypothetical protein